MPILTRMPLVKELHFVFIKSPKVICRAVHDATLSLCNIEIENSRHTGLLLLLLESKLLKNRTPEGASG